MKKLECEICGSTDIIKEDGLWVCQSCGAKYSTEEAKKMMVEGTVKIDNSSKIQNLKILADRALENKQYDEGYKYYEEILFSEADNYEAIFNMSLCKFYTSKLGNLHLDGVVSSAKSAIDIAKTKLDNEKLNDFVFKTVSEIHICGNMAFSNMLLTNLDVMSQKDGFYQAWASLDYCINLLYEFFENGISQFDTLKLSILKDLISFGEDNYFKIYIKSFSDGSGSFIPYNKFLGGYKSKLRELNKKEDLNVYEESNNLNNDLIDHLTINNNINLKGHAKSNLNDNPKKEDLNIQKDSNLKNNQKNGACYIATSVYGSYDSPEVWTLRIFRDNVLSKSLCGKLFIKCYYSISPTLVKYFGNKKWFNQLFKRILDEIIYDLKKKR
ncbi:MAG: TFIIB-type zinc finger domain-containing protein [Methanobrevibacter sp.]|jgi:transcription initiation factor TFIIIB Brf1 subunit/transcription initiation factor TFIIB|nr:TFIIB-type zinc finger domain-containing protein [Candidatus Methanoflexus mossambicus]